MNIFINSTWGKALMGKVLSKALKKKGFNAQVKIHDFKTTDESTDSVTLKIALEVKMTKNEINKLVDSIM